MADHENQNIGIKSIIPKLTGLAWLPLSLAMVMSISVVTTYIIAVCRGDVDAFFPYISDTGIKSPERSIFSEFFDFAAFISLITMYVRYRSIHELTNDRRILLSAKLAFAIAILSSIGITLVGNFQEETDLEIVHLTGACLVFVLGTVYMLIDSWITIKLHRSKAIFVVRLIIGILSAISCIMALTAGGISVAQGHNPNALKRIHWKPDDPGYKAHLISTFSEWAMALLFITYFCTFIGDFSKIEVDLHFRVNNDEDNINSVPPIAPWPGYPNERTPLNA